MPDENTPTIRIPRKKNKDKKGDSAEIPVSAENFNKVYEVFMLKGPETAAALDIDGAEQLVEILTETIYHSVEDAKPGIRRKVNKARNSTLGTLAEMGLVILGGGAGIYLAQKGARKFMKKRKNKKLARAAESSTPIADEILDG